jgi:hypothetical protein
VSIAVAALLSTGAVPVHAAAAANGAAADVQPTTDQNQQDIVVTAPPLFRDIQPERDLDQLAIESYGVSTIDELLGYIQSEVGTDANQPLILVNGLRINDVNEIGSYPVETLSNIRVLPPGSAARAGGRPGQRVISITLKPHNKTATLTAAHKLSTEGNWTAERGEALLTNVERQTRGNISIRGRTESPLLERDRGIVQPTPTLAYAQAGNIIGYPNNSGEIDPVLSAIAGQPVTTVPFPTGSAPGLSDLVAGANNPAVTDLGAFRSLRPSTSYYDLNGSFATPFASWLSSSTTIRFSHNESSSLHGLPAAIFVLSSANPFSPFSRDVGLAFYGRRPLHSRSRLNSGEINETLNATLGSWTANFNAKHNESTDITHIEREAVFGPIPLDDSINPFAAVLASMIELHTDRVSARNVSTLGQLLMNGPAAMLPAGAIQATVEARLAWNKLRSTSTFGAFGNGNFRRDEQSIRGALDVPIASRANNFLPQLGELSADGEYQHIHYSDAGALKHFGGGLTWEPAQFLRLRAEIEQTDVPPAIELLGDPVLEIPDVRVFDPLTGQTVDVTQITGGNRNLRPENDTIHRVNALLRLLPKLNLQLSAEYTDTNRRNFISSIPEASAAIELAFPDRFIRTNGILTTVDLRPVNFDSEHEKRLRWGLSMNKRLGGSAPGAPPAHGEPLRQSTYVQLTANHSIVFSDDIRVRPGLDSVDLLHGGAIGIGGGHVRHQVDGTAAITSGGLGVRIGLTWRGPSELDTKIGGVSDRLRFSSLLLANIRAFADVRRFVPRSNWAKGLRISLDAINITDSRQRVRAGLGNTPLQYQPAYRDPLGRTIELELRKVF